MLETSEASETPGAARADVRTFLIADVRGYTRYTLEHGDAAGAKLAERFAAIAREVVTAGGGELVEVRGDEALAVFGSTREALLASTELQQRYAQQTSAQPDMPFRVGIGGRTRRHLTPRGGQPQRQRSIRSFERS